MTLPAIQAWVRRGGAASALFTGKLSFGAPSQARPWEVQLPASCWAEARGDMGPSSQPGRKMPLSDSSLQP